MINLDVKNMSDNEISSLIQFLKQELEHRRILQDFIKELKDKKGE